MGSAPGTIPINQVINISVAFQAAGIPAYNVANLALFTGDAFLSNPNSDLYRVYTTLAQVGTDFGTTTETYTQAANVFAQQPNILNGGGSLIICPFATGCITGIGGTQGGTGYQVGDVLSVIIGSATGALVTVSATVAASGSISSVALTSVGINYSITSSATLSGGHGTSATLNITSVGTESLSQSIARCNNYLYYNGIIATNYGSNTTWASLAATVQGLGNQLLFLPSQSLTDIFGAFLTIQLATDYFTRCLYYGSGTATTARSFAAAYASRLLSTNYTGANTAITMAFKPLINVVPDTTLSTTLLTNLATAGVDCYANYGGSYPGVVSVGANKYADEAMNLIWLVTSLQVAGFNALATLSTKIPYTEAGMQALKAAYRQILVQAVSNGYLAPGTWPTNNTFGNQSLFLTNILQKGFYIYSSPVNAQTIAQITARAAPLIQIGALEAGAIQSSSVLININV